jgi:hypothetical protein
MPVALASWGKSDSPQGAKIERGGGVGGGVTEGSWRR